MTEAVFNKSGEKILNFSVSGHAMFQDYGYDIVCAAISSTTIMTVNGILEFANIKGVSYVQKDGYLSCDLQKIDDYSKISVLLNSYIEFLSEIQNQYPKNFKLVVKEV